MDIELNNEYIENDNYYRLTKFRIGTGQFQRPLPALDNFGRIHSAIRQEIDYHPFIESCVTVTLDELMAIDSIRENQRAFVDRNMVSRENGNLFTFFKVLLSAGESIADEHIQYINSLLSAPENSLIITPLLYRYHHTESGRISVDSPIDKDAYFDFTRKFLELVGGERDEVGIMLPFNITMTQIPELLELYKDFKTPFSAIDEAGKTNSDMYLQLRSLIGFGDTRSYNLIQKHGEKFMLYSFDAKPYRGRKDVVPAANILQFDNGFCSYGPRHTVKMRILRDSQNQNEPSQTVLPRIYYHPEYSYVRPEREDVKNDFLSWLDAHNIDNSMPYEKLVKNYKKDYDFVQQRDSTMEFNTLVEANELDRKLTNTSSIAQEIKRIKRNNRRMRQP